MPAALHSISVPIEPLQRGFWLYILEVEIEGEKWHYVGRTGDNGHLTACDPFSRLAMHIRTGKADNIVDKSRAKKMQDKRGLGLPNVTSVKFECYGPIFEEETGDGGEDHHKKHHEQRQKIAQLEKGLMQAMERVNPDRLLNRTKGAECPENEKWPEVFKAFSEKFPELKELSM